MKLTPTTFRPKRISGPRWRHLCITLFLLGNIGYSAASGNILSINSGDVSVLTHAELETSKLSVSRLRAIFSMRQRNWDDDTPIKVFVLPDKHPLHKNFCKSVLKVYPYVLRGHWDRITFSGTGVAPTVVSSEEQLRDLVSRTPGAIGYILNSTTNASDKTPLEADKETH